MNRADALLALATAPFVAALAFLIALALAWTFTRERRNRYMELVERARGER